MQAALFYGLSIVAIMCACGVVVSRNPIHSVLFLILTFFSISGHYILMNAQFIALVNIIVYAGAIMVLFLFVVMLLNLNKESEPHKSDLVKIIAATSAGLFSLVLVGVLKGATLPAYEGMMDSENGLVKNLGRVLFQEFLLPFELSSILFLSAMVGAVLLGKKNVQA
ncbi:MAG: NADH-quinone oxidoreductase subunit J [Chitinophagales bacterium]|nr:NADH-quinone oxidoreductase subunit J [Chitinophagales bacterium]